MKKSLILALAVVGVLSCQSCKEELDYTTQSNREENYTKAFIHQFGLIDPNHDWGFGRAKSRASAETNANEWYNPPIVDSQEYDDVMKYLHDHYDPTTGQIDETIDMQDEFFTKSGNFRKNYFVTNVGSWSFDFNENQAQPSVRNNNSFDDHDGDGNPIIKGSKMDYFYIKVRDGSFADITNSTESAESVWIHAKNYNGAGCPANNGNTLMVDSDAKDFAYHNTQDNGYHNRYIIIDGADINSRYTGFYYLCFDFDAHGGAKTFYHNVTISYPDGESTATKTFSEVTIEGGFKSTDTYPEIDEEIKEAVIALWSAEETGMPEGITTDNITIDSKSYHDKTQGNMYVRADNSYDDWVIRIVGNAIRKDSGETPEYYSADTPITDPEDPGTGGDDPGTGGDNPGTGDDEEEPTPEEPETPTVTYDCRIMVEDLSVHAQNNWEVSASDWDFNDLVIDVTLDDEGKATMIMRALGGTLPIYIEDKTGKRTADLHTFFHVASHIMVNTGDGVDRDPVVLTDVLADFRFLNDDDQADYNSIKIVVDLNGEEMVMEAKTGKAPSKICVPVTVEWAAEHQNIKEKYPDFTSWVEDSSIKFW